MKLTIQEIITAVGGTWLNPGEGAAPIREVCTDSRKIAEGCLFLPWVGEKFDGHDFIDAALEKGAAGCLCAKAPQTLRSDKFYIQVPDTRLALRALASFWRDRFEIPVVQITGSVGKTTTKEMVAAVLGAKYNTLKTQGNFNNDIGTPLTVANGWADLPADGLISTTNGHKITVALVAATNRKPIATGDATVSAKDS